MNSKAKEKAFLRQNLMAVIKRCNSLERIPSERILAAEFKVSRYLLRQCLAELARENIIKKGKRKQGNVMVGLHPWKRRIGIVTADGINCPYIDHPKVFNGIMNFFDRHENYLPQIMTFRNIEEFVLKIDQYELDSVVWIASNKKNVEKINKLPLEKKKRISLVVGDSLKPLIKHNSVSIDYEDLFDKRIQGLIDKGMRRFIYIAINSKYKDKLIAKLKKNDIEWDESMQISEASSIPEQLPDLINKNKPDVIICDGGFGFYELFSQTLAQQKKTYPLISVSNNWRMRKSLLNFPELHEINLQCHDTNAVHFQTGIVAMEMLDQALAEDKLQECRYLKVEPYFISAASLLERYITETNK